MAESKFQLKFSSSARDANELPTDFKYLQLLGTGSFGKVVKCLKKDTNQTVAVKIPLRREENSTEASTMEKLMCLKLDHCNIIQFFGWFNTSYGKAMVFESLDICLHDYILETHCAPMLLSDISTIIQQLATAFDALKSIGMIHTDLKLDNIMMVNPRRRPLRVKLIDFGLAMDRSKAKQGTTMQVVVYRAPEIMLGLPFSEAIDMWSLGCVMYVMLQGKELFRGETEYKALHDVTALLGLPEDHMLENGLKAERYFTKSESNSWRLKTHQEYWREHANTQTEYKTKVCGPLDNLKKLRLEKKNILEAAQRARCIDLLKAMLILDEAKRITPIGILTHPFITSGQHSFHTNRNRFRLKNQEAAPDSTELPPGVILVRPATAENRLLQDGRGEVLVCPADTTTTVLLDIKEEISEEPSVTASEDNNILRQRSSPSPPSTPPGVILVQPAAAENMLQLDEEDRAATFPDRKNKTYSVKVADLDIVDGDIAAGTNDGAVTQKKTEQKKKKKNCVRRFFSWVKRTFGSCSTAAVDQDDEGHK